MILISGRGVAYRDWDVGDIRSVNVDMSSDKVCEKYVCRKFKVFYVMFIGVG